MNVPKRSSLAQAVTDVRRPIGGSLAVGRTMCGSIIATASARAQYTRLRVGFSGPWLATQPIATYLSPSTLKYIRILLPRYIAVQQKRASIANSSLRQHILLARGMQRT